MSKQEKEKIWLDDLIDFYDFIWSEGVQACGSCINDELLDDFQQGGNKFNEMKSLILKKFPTKKDAETAFHHLLDKEDK